MTAEPPADSRLCREARAQLPFLAAGEVTGWGARVVRAHVRHCADCSAELQRQREVAGALSALRARPPEPPPGLLDDLLAGTRRPGVRGRAAVPARGAVSGARPGMSVAFLTVGALASTGAGYAVYRGARALLRHRRG